ncbi:MAG: inositol monophosphatase family protein [Thermoleophilaceae bacterium]
MSLSGDLELAERIARAAGDLLLERFRRPASGLAAKSSATDPVSDADREAEALIARSLLDARPDDGLLAEEGASADAAGEPGAGRRWIVDPLDGTVNFLYGHAAWAVSIALEDADGLAAGVVHDPARSETFSALRGGGCRLNGAPVRVSGCAALETALVATGFGYEAQRRAVQAEALVRILPRVRDIRRAGSAALDLAWVAAGRLDGYWERGLKPWDWAAGRLLVEEAGGATRWLSGEPAGLAAASPGLLPALVDLVG